MNLEKLQKDWKSSPQLRAYAFETVGELAQYLTDLHRKLMGGQFGGLGYLYREQTLRVKQLQEELQNVKRK